jgi:NADH dehydrogenase
MRFREEHRKVRALVRGGGERAEGKELLVSGIEVVDGELTRPETLEPACAGVEAVVCTATSVPKGKADDLRRVDHEGILCLVEAAERAGVKKFVYISHSKNICEESPFEHAKRDCERRLLKSSLQAVILRPSYFMEIWLGPMLGFDPEQGSARIYGPGEAKISYISAFDVAEFALAAVVQIGNGHVILEIGGPEPLSQLDAVRVFEDVLQKKFRLLFVSLETLRTRSVSSDTVERTLAALMLACAKGDVIPESGANASRYGIHLHSVAEYASTWKPGIPPPISALAARG